MNKIKLLFVLSFVFFEFLLSCQKTRSDIDQTANIQGGRCRLIKGNNSYLCIDFNSGTDSNTDSTTCTTEYNRYSTSTGLNGISWLSGNSNTCSTASSDTSVGSCTRADGIIRYYDTYFNASTAQVDCTTTHGGTWTP